MSETEQNISTHTNLNNENNATENGKENEQKYRQETYQQPKCNLRIEELAKPRKMLVYAMYTQFKTLLPKPNAIAVKQYLEEEYAKNTGDIVEYFTKLKKGHDSKHKQHLSKLKARRKDKDKMARQKREEMLHNIKELLKKTLFNAYMNPKQIIMTSMIRKVSDKILFKLCNIRRMKVPDREDSSIKAELMCTISDWLAYCVDSIYYELQVRKVNDYDELMKYMQSENNAKEEKQ